MRNGIPSLSEYRQLIESVSFRDMEVFSDQYLKNNAMTLAPYIEKWIVDPLHQWSRQWEYPFVYSRIEALAQSSSPRFLDAGSGATFFPFYLMHQLPNAKVDCCDYDESLVTLYDSINANQQSSVDFSIADLRKLPFEDNSFDVVYCVSVLEHTNAYEAIMKEFRRVTVPNGSVVITFDISLDGRGDIPPKRAEELLSLIVGPENQSSTVEMYPSVSAELAKPSIVTTTQFANTDPHRLPWSKPSFVDHLKSLARSGRLRQWPNPLTFYCLDVVKN